LAYMRLVINHLDAESLRRIINYPARTIGDKTVAKLIDLSSKHRISPLDFIFDIDNIPNDFNAGTRTKLKKFGELISNLTEVYRSGDAYSTANAIITASGIMEELSSNDDIENVSRRENIHELLNAIHEYCEQKKSLGEDNPSLSEFLSEVSLLTDQDTDRDGHRDCVTLMTIHSAKGLEFAYVFVAGIEEDLLPSSMCQTEYEIEEERRLLYVAITRAKRRCFLSYSKTRFRWGNVCYCSPSRFLSDIDEQYLDMPQAFAQYPDEAPSFERGGGSFPSFVPPHNIFKKASSPHVAPTELPTGNLRPLGEVVNNGGNVKFDFSVGDSVTHAVFGRGTVIELINDGSNSKARVDFDSSGQKTLLLKYSKLVKN